MWLLNVDTRRLECFEGRDLPKYAILSHRWGNDEVSFQDIRDGTSTCRQGYPKIDNFCKTVVSNEAALLHVWIDTCCIDKTNNSELSEAINSMYRWYMQATVCYAYLADVSREDQATFFHSVWFFRGWTLQELLAPDSVEFFDGDWNKLGTKLELSDSITQITGIPTDALKHFDSRRSPHSVADRMSWAVQRKTTREEDLAYSLLGIFGVNMPLLYGEGTKAFLRLQEEILKISEDLTILAWQRFPRLPQSNDYLRDTSVHDFGLFAASPESYDHKNKSFRSLLDGPSYKQDVYLESTFSGAGLTINLVLIPYCPEIYIAPLCSVSETGSQSAPSVGKIAAMFVERTGRKGRYKRVAYDGYSLIVDHPENLNVVMGRKQRVILERTPYHAMARQLRGNYGFTILQIEEDISKLFQMNHQDSIDIIKRNPSHTSLLLEPGEVGVAGMVHLKRRKLPPIYFHFGFDFDFNPFCLLSRPTYEDTGPRDHKIIFETPFAQSFSVQRNSEIMRLVSILQAEPRKINLHQHNVELYTGSWTLNEMQFVGRDCRIGLDVSAAYQQGYVYHVYIGLAHKDYPWASDHRSPKWDVVSREEVIWYCKPWNNT